MPEDFSDSHGVPIAPAEPFARELHESRWIDEYAWMRDHSDPRLLDYLARERRYYDSAASAWRSLQEELFGEVRRRLPLTESSVSWRRGTRLYYTRTDSGSEYVQLLQMGESDRVLLDPARLAGVEGFAEIGLREISPDGSLLAYSVDTTGDEVYRLRFRSLESLQDLPEELPRTYYTGAWSADGASFFYTVHDTLFRPYQVWRHVIGTLAESDVLVLQEDDARFEVTVKSTRDGRWIIISAESRITSECWTIPASCPDAAPVAVRPRREGVQYAVDSELVITTNEDEPEFHVPGVHPSRPGERVRHCHVLSGYWLIELRRDGRPLMRAIDRATGSEVEIEGELFPEFEYGDRSVIVKVQSLIDPPAWYRVDLGTGAREPIMSQETPHYDPSGYRTCRFFVGADKVPVTLAWHKDTPLDGTHPALLYGYGAYESCLDPEFDPMLPSLLDRGVIYALAHVRGGGEMGRRWWLDGRLQAKENTFTDYLAVADWLGDGIADGARLVTRGLSAGGLLQGAVFSRRPERWAAVVAEVPFVDVVTSMLDPGIPLTVNEWEEWGDPRRPADFAWLRAYSPYENVPSVRRPPLLVTVALHDPRVMVHEPAKWVARLRATAQSGDGPLFLRAELGAGAHTGPAGRLAHFQYEAEVAAFWLRMVDLTE